MAEILDTAAAQGQNLAGEATPAAANTAQPAPTPPPSAPVGPRQNRQTLQSALAGYKNFGTIPWIADAAAFEKVMANETSRKKVYDVLSQDAELSTLPIIQGGYETFNKTFASDLVAAKPKPVAPKAKPGQPEVEKGVWEDVKNLGKAALGGLTEGLRSLDNAFMGAGLASVPVVGEQLQRQNTANYVKEKKVREEKLATETGLGSWAEADTPYKKALVAANAVGSTVPIIAIGAVNAPAAVMAGGGMAYTGNIESQAERIAKAKGKTAEQAILDGDVNEGIAAAAAVIQGTIDAAGGKAIRQAMKATGFAGPMVKFLEEAIKGKVLQATTRAARTTAGRAVVRAAQTQAGRAATAIVKTGASAAKGAATEAPTEALQEVTGVVQSVLADDSRSLSERLADGISPETIGQIKEAGIVGSLGGGFLAGAGRAVNEVARAAAPSATAGQAPAQEPQPAANAAGQASGAGAQTETQAGQAGQAGQPAAQAPRRPLADEIAESDVLDSQTIKQKNLQQAYKEAKAKKVGASASMGTRATELSKTIANREAAMKGVGDAAPFQVKGLQLSFEQALQTGELPLPTFESLGLNPEKPSDRKELKRRQQDVASINKVVKAAQEYQAQTDALKGQFDRSAEAKAFADSDEAMGQTRRQRMNQTLARLQADPSAQIPDADIAYAYDALGALKIQALANPTLSSEAKAIVVQDAEQQQNLLRQKAGLSKTQGRAKGAAPAPAAQTDAPSADPAQAAEPMATEPAEAALPDQDQSAPAPESVSAEPVAQAPESSAPVQEQAAQAAEPAAQAPAAEAGRSFGTDAYRQGQRQVAGRTDRQYTPKNQSVSGQYKLVDAATLTPSHNPYTFGENRLAPTRPDGRSLNDRDYKTQVANQAAVIAYGNDFKGVAVDNMPWVSQEGVVLGGNNRTMSRIRAAEQGSDADYVARLKEQLPFYGIDPSAMEGMEAPMLVFEEQEGLPYTTETYSKLNEDPQKGKSKEEKVTETAARMNPQTRRKLTNVFDGAEKMADVLNSQPKARRLMDALIEAGLMQANKRTEFVSKNGNLTRAGKDAVRNAMLGSVLTPEVAGLVMQDGNGKLAMRVDQSTLALLRNSLRDDSVVDNVNLGIKLAYEAQQVIPVNRGKQKGKIANPVAVYLASGNLDGIKPYPIEAVSFAVLLSQPTQRAAYIDKETGQRVEGTRLVDLINTYNAADAGTPLFGGGESTEAVAWKILDKFANDETKKFLRAYGESIGLRVPDGFGQIFGAPGRGQTQAPDAGGQDADVVDFVSENYEEIASDEAYQDFLKESKTEAGDKQAEVESLSQHIKDDLAGKKLKLSAKVKAFIKRLANSVRTRVVAGLMAVGIGVNMVTATDVTRAYNMESVGQIATRALAKVGLIDPNNFNAKVVAPKRGTVADTGLGKVKVFGKVKDKAGSEQDSLWMYEREGRNGEMYYVPGPNMANSNKYNMKDVTGVEGVAHFIISPVDLTKATSSQAARTVKEALLAEIRSNNPDNYVPCFRKVGDKVALTFKKASDVADADVVVTQLVQHTLSDIDFDNHVDAPSFKTALCVTDKNGNPIESIQFTGDPSMYGRFAGGSFFLLGETDNGLVVREMSGSVDMLRASAKDMAKKYNLPESRIKVGVMDAGSFSAKPAARQGVVSVDQYSGFNNEANVGASLMIPKQQGPQGQTGGDRPNVLFQAETGAFRAPEVRNAQGQLVAPNGKPSMLSESQWHLVRSPEFKNWFGDWQSDPANASKVVDENGEPMVVYRGDEDASDINVYDHINNLTTGVWLTPSKGVADGYARNVLNEGPAKSRQFFINARKLADLAVGWDVKRPGNYDGAEFNKEGQKVAKAWAKKNKDIVDDFDGLLESVFSNGQLYNTYGFNVWNQIPKTAAQLGFDAVAFIDINIDQNIDAAIPDKSYVVFDSSNLKLADGTNTTFDGENPDIRFSSDQSTAAQTDDVPFDIPPSADLDLRDVAEYARDIESLKEILQKSVGLTPLQANASAEIMDAIVGRMAERAGVSKAEMYERIGFADVREDGTPGVNGFVQIYNDGRSVIAAMASANVSTPLHEIAHVYETYLTDEERQTVLDWTQDSEWTRETSERFARGFELYLKQGKAPNSKLQAAFEAFRSWMMRLYAGARRAMLGDELSPAMEELYANMVGKGDRNMQGISLPGLEITESSKAEAQPGARTLFQLSGTNEVNDALKQATLRASRNMKGITPGVVKNLNFTQKARAKAKEYFSSSAFLETRGVNAERDAAAILGVQKMARVGTVALNRWKWYNDMVYNGLGEADRSVMRARILFGDIVSSIKKGLYDDDGQGNQKSLPYKIPSFYHAYEMLDGYKSEVEAKGLGERVNYRNRFWEDLYKEMKRVGMIKPMLNEDGTPVLDENGEPAFEDKSGEEYFHRQILDYAEQMGEPQSNIPFRGANPTKDKTLGNTKQRMGSDMDYNPLTDLVDQAVILSTVYEIENRKIVKDILDPYRKMEADTRTEAAELVQQQLDEAIDQGDNAAVLEIQADRLGKEQAAFEGLMAEKGFVSFDPQAYLLMHPNLAAAKPEQMVSMLKQILKTHSMLDAAMEAGIPFHTGIGAAQSETMYIPETLKAEFDLMQRDAASRKQSVLRDLYQDANGLWKDQMLNGVEATPKYLTGNMVSDISNATSAQILPQVVKEVAWGTKGRKSAWRQAMSIERKRALGKVLQLAADNQGTALGKVYAGYAKMLGAKGGTEMDAEQQQAVLNSIVDAGDNFTESRAAAVLIVDRHFSAHEQELAMTGTPEQIAELARRKTMRAVKKHGGNMVRFLWEWGGIRTACRTLARVRENAFRIAGQRAFMDQTQAYLQGKRQMPVGLSQWDQIRGLMAQNPQEAANKMAREVFGDYGTVSRFAKKASRTGVASFVKYPELNARAMANLFESAGKRAAAQSDALGETGALRVARRTAHLAKAGALRFILTAATSVWNNKAYLLAGTPLAALLWDEEEIEDLKDQELQRNIANPTKLPLSIGRDNQGNPAHITTQEPAWQFLDDAQILSLSEAIKQETLMDGIGYMLTSGINKGYQMVGGVWKPILEAGIGVSSGGGPLSYGSGLMRYVPSQEGEMFGSMQFNPTPVGDTKKQLVRGLFRLDKTYDAITGSPGKGFTFGGPTGTVAGMLGGTTNVEQTSYHKLRRTIDDLQGVSGNSLNPQDNIGAAVSEWKKTLRSVELDMSLPPSERYKKAAEEPQVRTALDRLLKESEKPANEQLEALLKRIQAMHPLARIETIYKDKAYQFGGDDVRIVMLAKLDNPGVSDADILAGKFVAGAHLRELYGNAAADKMPRLVSAIVNARQARGADPKQLLSLYKAIERTGPNAIAELRYALNYWRKEAAAQYYSIAEKMKQVDPRIYNAMEMDRQNRQVQEAYQIGGAELTAPPATAVPGVD